MAAVGGRCHELRIRDENENWRIVYRLDQDAVVIGEVFSKKTRATPRRVIENREKAIRRLRSGHIDLRQVPNHGCSKTEKTEGGRMAGRKR